jgi:nicotinic acid mononucleotide adenylyltransferase
MEAGGGGGGGYYQVVNSYQGAFGPPTLGHYEAMSAAARTTLKNYGGAKILMLFMPTAASSSKTHLLHTQKERIESLNVYCKMLKKLDEFKDEPITFEASDIEYKIYSEKKSTATIHTLIKLKELYPSSTIELTMGLDNLYDLPFWADVQDYSKHTQKIYIAKREPTDEDKHNTESVSLKDDGNTLLFNKFASWDKNKDNTNEKTTLQAKLDKVKQSLAKIEYEFLESKITPTSSSILRCVMKMIATQPRYISSFKKLVGVDWNDLEKAEPWKKMLKATGDFSGDTPEKCAPVYAELENEGNPFYPGPHANAGGGGGGASTAEGGGPRRRRSQAGGRRSKRKHAAKHKKRTQKKTTRR